MSRPTTKAGLLEAIEIERGALEQLLAELSPEQLIEPEIVGNWSVKDVLAHLLEWEEMVLHWHAAGLRGEIPITPSEEFNWGQLPQLNHKIFKKHHSRPLADIQKEFTSSYKETLKTIQGLSDEDLFTRGHYTWTKKNTLGAYFISSTSSHYRWARMTIKKGLKAKKVYPEGNTP